MAVRIFVSLILVAVFVASVVVADAVTYFWDFFTLIKVLTFPSLGLVWANPRSEQFSFVKFLTFQQGSLESDRDCQIIADRLAHLTMLGGLATFMIGLVLILTNLSSFEAIGPGLAVSSFAVLYASLIAAVFKLYALFYHAKGS